MSWLIEKPASFLGRQRPVTLEDAADISAWVTEGGTADPAGPPRVINEAEIDEDHIDEDQRVR